jgi:hypothetical protein
MPFNNDCHVIYEKYRLLRENLQGKMQFLIKQVPDDVKDKEAFVQDVANRYDPSQEKVFTSWILKMMRTGSIRGEEDMQKTRETLQDFIQAKLRKKLQGPEADINFYKSLGSLTKLMTEKLGKILTKREQMQAQAEKGFVRLSEKGNFSLYMITTPEAANKHMQQTGWCVKDPKWWDSYKKNHKTETYFVIYDKTQDVIEREERGEKKIYDKRKHRLFNFSSNEYKNVFDEEVDPTKQEAKFVMTQKDVIEKNLPDVPSDIYLTLSLMAGVPVSQDFIEKVIQTSNTTLARRLLDSIYE